VHTEDETKHVDLIAKAKTKELLKMMYQHRGTWNDAFSKTYIDRLSGGLIKIGRTIIVF